MFHKAPEINIQHHPLKGEHGLPEYYPAPPLNSNSLFYIQRNQNQNTVVYELNRLHDGSINQEYPMNVFWIRYSDQGEQKELNYIQNKLAYGYHSSMINKDCFQFHLAAYEKQKFYIDLQKGYQNHIYTKLEGRLCRVTNLYVFAEELGVFPRVKFVEFYGFDVQTQIPAYHKSVFSI